MTNKEKYQQAFSVLKSSRKIEMEDLKVNIERQIEFDKVREKWKFLI